MALELIAPQVPDANQNEGAKLGLQGLLGGLAAAARFAEMRRKSESDIAELAMKERVSQEAHDLELKKIEAEAPLIDAHRKYYESLVDLTTSKANAYANNTATAAQRAIAFNQQRQDLVNEVNNEASKLQLDDPNFATKEPVKFAANVMQFKDMFGLSPLPEVKNAITRYQQIADQQKIPLKIGATFDEDKAAWVGGKPQMVPIWQVVRNLQDPLQADDTANALQASGHMKVIQDFETIAGTRKGTGQTFSEKVPVTRNELSPQLKSAVEEGKRVQFQHVPSRVPSAMLPKAAAAGTTPTELPAPDLPPDTTDQSLPDPQASNASPQFDPTDTDRIIQHAKAAIAQGAPSAVVAQRLQENFGIDPSVLFEAAA